MNIQSIYPVEMQRPKGHYSPGIVHNGLVFVSGQLPIDSAGQVHNEGIEEQVIMCMKNIETILKAAGSELQYILKVNVFISDVRYWPTFNEIYSKIMGDHRPARIVVPCKQLNHHCDIEIDCIAALPAAKPV